MQPWPHIALGLLARLLSITWVCPHHVSVTSLAPACSCAHSAHGYTPPIHTATHTSPNQTPHYTGAHSHLSAPVCWGPTLLGQPQGTPGPSIPGPQHHLSLSPSPTLSLAARQLLVTPRSAWVLDSTGASLDATPGHTLTAHPHLLQKLSASLLPSQCGAWASHQPPEEREESSALSQGLCPPRPLSPQGIALARQTANCANLQLIRAA